jgi:hypothetical protein
VYTLTLSKRPVSPFRPRRPPHAPRGTVWRARAADISSSASLHGWKGCRPHDNRAETRQTQAPDVLSTHDSLAPRRPTHPGVGGLPTPPARPYSAPISDTNNGSDIERPGGAEINKMSPPGGTGPTVIFPDIARYVGGPHGRPFGAAGSRRRGGALSIHMFEVCNKKPGGWHQKYGALAPLKVHLVRDSL